jgi:hypothetical protein
MVDWVKPEVLNYASVSRATDAPFFIELLALS